jgi:hypothetical protein
MAMTGKPATRLSMVLAVAAALALLSNGAFAGDANGEARTAAQHAGYAAGSDTLEMVHTHLHHAVNCLVGPNGADFDSGVLNPCKGMGDGAIPDATDMKTKKALTSALEAAKSGIAADDLSAAQDDAKKTADILKTATSSAY